MTPFSLLFLIHFIDDQIADGADGADHICRSLLAVLRVCFLSLYAPVAHSVLAALIFHNAAALGAYVDELLAAPAAVLVCRLVFIVSLASFALRVPAGLDPLIFPEKHGVSFPTNRDAPDTLTLLMIRRFVNGSV